MKHHFNSSTTTPVTSNPHLERWCLWQITSLRPFHLETPLLILRCKLCFSGGYAIGFSCCRICKLPNLLEVGRYPDIVRQPEKVSGPWIHKHLFSRFIRKRIKKVYQFLIVSRKISISMISDWSYEMLRAPMDNAMTNFRLTLSLVQASGSIHLLQDHKGVYTSQSTFCHVSSPQKMLPHCRHVNDAARAFTISCSWLAAAFFFSTYPAAFTTFTPCFRHRSRAIATYSFSGQPSGAPQIWTKATSTSEI